MNVPSPFEITCGPDQARIGTTADIAIARYTAAVFSVLMPDLAVAYDDDAYRNFDNVPGLRAMQMNAVIASLRLAGELAEELRVAKINAANAADELRHAGQFGIATAIADTLPEYDSAIRRLLDPPFGFTTLHLTEFGMDIISQSGLTLDSPTLPDRIHAAARLFADHGTVEMPTPPPLPSHWSAVAD